MVDARAAPGEELRDRRVRDASARAARSALSPQRDHRHPHPLVRHLLESLDAQPQRLVEAARLRDRRARRCPTWSIRPIIAARSRLRSSRSQRRSTASTPRNSRSASVYGSRRSAKPRVDLARRGRPRSRAAARTRSLSSVSTRSRSCARRRSASSPLAPASSRWRLDCGEHLLDPLAAAAPRSARSAAASSPRRARRARASAARSRDGPLGAVAVGLVEHEDVGDLHDAGLDRLDVVAQARAP